MEKTTIERLDESLAEIAALNADLVATREHLASAQAANAAAVAEIEQLRGTVAKLTGDVAASEQRMAVALADLQAAASEIESLKKKLSLSAFDDIAGAKPVADGGEVLKTKSLREQFAAISDPVERTRFWKAQRAALVAGK